MASGKLQGHTVALPELRSVQRIPVGDHGGPGRIRREAEFGPTPGDGFEPRPVQKAQQLLPGSQDRKAIPLLASGRKEHRPNHTGERQDQTELKEREPFSQPE
jgi:hypothetical protein